MVTPILKGESALDVTIYKPVSVLPIISKVLEKLMLSMLISFLDKNVLTNNMLPMEIKIIFEIKTNIPSADRREASNLDTLSDFKNNF